MHYAELFTQVCGRLTTAGCDTPEFDAACLLSDIGGLPPCGMPKTDMRQVSPSAEKAVIRAADERASGRPLQYILGQWDFLDLTFSVGEGVLVPRPDTERLCEVAAAWLDTHDVGDEVADLCAGSGCVGLGTARLCNRPLRVTALDLSDTAFEYLQKNIARYPQYDVTPVKADVLHDAAKFGQFAALLSNPPYIPTADLPSLMREVQHEPTMALDGSADGLQFYRAIATEWVPHLKSGGLCAVEIGFDQAQSVATIFEKAGLLHVQIFHDYADLPRVVIGEKN